MTVFFASTTAIVPMVVAWLINRKNIATSEVLKLVAKRIVTINSKLIRIRVLVDGDMTMEMKNEFDALTAELAEMQKIVERVSPRVQ